MLTNKMLLKLITPTHEGLAHASQLKCYVPLGEDFTNKMFKKIKGDLKKCYDFQTGRQLNLYIYVEMQSVIQKNTEKGS